MWKEGIFFYSQWTELEFSVKDIDIDIDYRFYMIWQRLFYITSYGGQFPSTAIETSGDFHLTSSIKSNAHDGKKKKKKKKRKSSPYRQNKTNQLESDICVFHGWMVSPSIKKKAEKKMNKKKRKKQTFTSLSNDKIRSTLKVMPMPMLKLMPMPMRIV